jgi:choline monooxygenase
MTALAALNRDPAVLARDHETVFARKWLFLGFEADLAGLHDYIAETLAGCPVLAVRGDGASPFGFHAVCRHRAGPLAGDAASSCGQALVCRYHGGRYALDGRLRRAVGFSAAEGCDPQGFGRHPVRIVTWRGLVFVNLETETAPLMQTLAPLDRLFGDRVVPAAVLRRRRPIACNWKADVENYLEGCHISPVSLALVAEAEAGDFVFRMEGADAIYEATATSAAAEGLWAWVWTNLAFNLYRGVAMVEHMRPAGHGATELDYIYLHQHGDPSMDAALTTAEQLTREDRWICEHVQQNLDAGVYQAGARSLQRENGVARFQACLVDQIAA